MWRMNHWTNNEASMEAGREVGYQPGQATADDDALDLWGRNGKEVEISKLWFEGKWITL